MFQKAKEMMKSKRRGRISKASLIPVAPVNVIRNAKVWAIPARKGGVLKTSLIVNLAGALASEGNKVCIVDLDSQGNTIVAFGGNPDTVSYNIYDILTTPHAPIRPAIINVYPNIDIISANERMDDLDFVVIPDKEKFPFPFTLLREALQGLRCDYDYILIDTPPNSTLIQSNALMFADNVLIPFQPESFSMRSLVKTINTITKFKKHHNPKLELLGIVATLVDMRTSIHCEIMENTRRFCREKEIPMMHTIIPRLTRGTSDISYKELPTTLASPNDRLSDYYFDLLEEVLSHG